MKRHLPLNKVLITNSNGKKISTLLNFLNKFKDNDGNGFGNGNFGNGGGNFNGGGGGGFNNFGGKS